MKDMGIVQGSLTQAQPLIVGVDTVYIHTNIVKIETDSMGNVTDNLYQYNEIQYSKDEWNALQAEKANADIAYLAMMTGVKL